MELLVNGYFYLRKSRAKCYLECAGKSMKRESLDAVAYETNSSLEIYTCSYASIFCAFMMLAEQRRWMYDRN